LHRDAKQGQESTAEETEKLVCVMNSASGPPTEAITTLTRISIAHLKERNMVYKMRKMARTVIER